MRLPLMLIPLREFVAQELFKIMLRVAQGLSLEFAAVSSRGIRTPVAIE